MNILCVDDTKAVHAFIDSLFVEVKVSLDHVYSGQEAVDKIKSGESIDLILLDWEMPLKTGLETLSEIRSISSVPVIMVTSRDSPDDLAEAVSLGADEYVMKPFTSGRNPQLM